MSELIRFGVSLDKDLLSTFDDLIKQIGYDNRSEAIRDLIRDRLVRKQWQEGRSVLGILGLIYNHEKRDLTENLTRIQHEHINMVVSSTHIHLDHHNCLEVIILKGEAGLIRRMADRLLSTKSVIHGDLIMTSAGKELS